MNPSAKKRLLVCVNERLGLNQESCAASGSHALIKILKKQLNLKKMDAEIVEQVCLGRCTEGVAMRISPGGPFFTHVTERDIAKILKQLQDFVPGDQDILV